MSLSSFAAPLAFSLIESAGFPVSFSRDVADLVYDPIENLSTPNTLEWAGTAIWTSNRRKFDPTYALSEGTGRTVVDRALLVSGLSVADAPAPGDTVTVNFVAYRASAVTFIGDADGGDVPLYRVAVTQ